MAKIENYSNDTNITDNDRLFGTSVDGAISTTANFKASELKSFINSGYSTSSEVATDIATAKAEAIAAAATDTDNDVAAATSSITTAYQTYADQAEADARAYTDTRETAITTAYQTYANQAEADAITSANGYTDTRETAITSAYQAYADQAEADANTYTNNKVATNATSISNITHQVIAAKAVSTTATVANDTYVINFSSLGSDASTNTLEYNTTTNDALSVAPDDGTIINDAIGADVNVKIAITALTSTTASATITYGIERDSGSGFSNIQEFERDKSGSGDHVDSFFIYTKIPDDNTIRFTFKSSHGGSTLNVGSWIEVTRI